GIPAADPVVTRSLSPLSLVEFTFSSAVFPGRWRVPGPRCVTMATGTGASRGAGWRVGALLFPALLGLAVFVLGPALVSAFAAGTDKTLTGPSFHWVGTANLRQALHDPDFGRSVVNTLEYCALTVIPALVVGL